MIGDLRQVTSVVFISRLSSFVTIPILTRSLAQANYGIYRGFLLFVGLSLFFTSIANFGPLLQKRLPELDRERKRSFTSATALVMGGIIVASLVLVVVFTEIGVVAQLSTGLDAFVREYFLLVIVFLLLKGAFKYILEVCKGDNSYALYSKARGMRELLFSVPVLVLYPIGGIVIERVLIVLLVSYAIPVMFTLRYYGPWLLEFPDFHGLYNGFKSISLPLVPRIFLIRMANWAPNLAVLSYFGPTVFAAWSVVFAFDKVFGFVYGPFNKTLIPKFSERISNGRSVNQIVFLYYRVVLLLTLPAIVGGSLVGSETLRYVFRLETVIDPVAIGLLVVMFGVRGINTISSRFFIATGNSELETKKQAISTTLEVVLVAGIVFSVQSIVALAAALLVKSIIDLVYFHYHLHQYVDLELPARRTVGKVSLSLVALAGTVIWLKPLVNGALTLLLVVFLGAIVYVGSILSLRLVTERDRHLINQFVLGS